MSVAAAMMAVGTVLAAKTAIEGIQEGNLLKAALGGVGAYFGVTGLQGVGAAAATNATGAAGGNIAADAAANTTLQTASQEAAKAGAEISLTGTNGASALSDGISKNMLNTMKGVGDKIITQQSQSPGLLSQAMTWANDNPVAAGGIVQMGGGLLQGYSQQKQSDEEMKALEQSRQRRQLVGNTSFLSQKVFNPTTGRFEVA